MQLLQTDLQKLHINMKTGFVKWQTGLVPLQTGFEIKINIGVSVGCHIEPAQCVS